MSKGDTYLDSVGESFAELAMSFEGVARAFDDLAYLMEECGQALLPVLNWLDRLIWMAPGVSHVIIWLWKVRSRVQYWLTGDCGNECGFVEPYGFVPEADCPVHDVARDIDSSDRRKEHEQNDTT